MMIHLIVSPMRDAIGLPPQQIIDQAEIDEVLDFNTFCDHVGEMTPVYVYLDE